MCQLVVGAILINIGADSSVVNGAMATKIHILPHKEEDMLKLPVAVTDNKLSSCAVRYREYVDACWLRAAADVVSAPFFDKGASKISSIIAELNPVSRSNVGLLVGHFDDEKAMDLWIKSVSDSILYTERQVGDNITIKMYRTSNAVVSRAFCKGFDTKERAFYALVL